MNCWALLAIFSVSLHLCGTNLVLKAGEAVGEVLYHSWENLKCPLRADCCNEYWIPNNFTSKYLINSSEEFQ